VSVRARESLGFVSIAYYIVGLYDPATSSWAWSNTINPVSWYEWFNYTVDPALISPGKTYYFAVGVVGVTRFAGIVIVYTDFRVDYASIAVQTVEYSFSGSIIELNATDSSKAYYARLLLQDYDLDSGLNAVIGLQNWTLDSSTTITISNGSPSATETGWIRVTVPPPGYSAARILVEFTKPSPVNSTLKMVLEYCTLPLGAGACVYYPLTITLDPSNTRVDAAIATTRHINTSKGAGAHNLPSNIPFRAQPITISQAARATQNG
jgi:hypothetical protein